MGTNYGSRSAAWWDPNLRNPYVMNWQRRHPVRIHEGTTLLDVSYQGSGGVGLIENWQTNTFPIDYFAGNPAMQSPGIRARRKTTGPSPTSAMSACVPISATRHSTPAR